MTESSHRRPPLIAVSRMQAAAFLLATFLLLTGVGFAVLRWLDSTA